MTIDPPSQPAAYNSYEATRACYPGANYTYIRRLLGPHVCGSRYHGPAPLSAIISLIATSG
jgi:hypothetical protein